MFATADGELGFDSGELNLSEQLNLKISAVLQRRIVVSRSTFPAQLGLPKLLGTASHRG